MPFVTGTSTDYKDLLNDLRDYIISAPAGSDWVVERDTSGGAPDQVEMIFKGNGGPQKRYSGALKPITTVASGTTTGVYEDLQALTLG